MNFKFITSLALLALASLVATAPTEQRGTLPNNDALSQAASSTIVATSSPASSQVLASPFPYVFPEQKYIGTNQLFPMPLCNGIPLEEASIDEIRLALTIRKLNVTTLAGCYIDRINQVDRYVKYVYLVSPFPSFFLASNFVQHAVAA